MNTDTNVGSPATTTQQSTDSQNQNTNSNNSLNADEIKAKYDKVLEENKRYRQEKVAAETKLAELDRKSLEEQGKYKELFESTKKERDQLHDDLTKTKATFGNTSVTSQVKLEAQKSGCKDVDLLLSHYKKEIQTLSIDDKFNVDSKDVSRFLDKVKKEKPLLFEKDAPKFDDGLPGGFKVKDTNLKDVKVDDLYKAFLKPD